MKEKASKVDLPSSLNRGFPESFKCPLLQFKKWYKKCFVTLSKFQFHERKYTKLPYIAKAYETLERLMAEAPALHFKRYGDQSLLVITISSSSWHPAMRRASGNSRGSPPPSLGEHDKGRSQPLSSVQVKLLQTFTLTTGQTLCSDSALPCHCGLAC